MSDSGKIEHTTGTGAPSPAGPRPPGMPGWVKAFIGVGLALLVLVAVMLLAGGGGHGPSRHTSSGQPSAQPDAGRRAGALL